MEGRSAGTSYGNYDGMGLDQVLGIGKGGGVRLAKGPGVGAGDGSELGEEPQTVQIFVTCRATACPRKSAHGWTRDCSVGWLMAQSWLRERVSRPAMSWGWTMG